MEEFSNNANVFAIISHTFKSVTVCADAHLKKKNYILKTIYEKIFSHNFEHLKSS